MLINKKWLLYLVTVILNLNQPVLADQLYYDKQHNQIINLTAELQITIHAGAIIAITQDGSDWIIYDLHQTNPNQVIIQLSSQKTVLYPGRACAVIDLSQRTITGRHPDLPIHSFVCRMMDNQKAIWDGSFDFLSALTTLPSLKAILQSEDKRDQEILHQILLTIVILQKSSYIDWTPGRTLQINHAK